MKRRKVFGFICGIGMMASTTSELIEELYYENRHYEAELHDEQDQIWESEKPCLACGSKFRHCIPAEGLVTCLSCGTKKGSGSKFCSRCGERGAKNMNLCTSCALDAISEPFPFDATESVAVRVQQDELFMPGNEHIITGEHDDDWDMGYLANLERSWAEIFGI